MNSLRGRLLIALLTLLAVAAVIMGGVTYRSVLAETEALFDYQLRQMALSLRDQGEIAPDQARAFADEQLDFVIQIWTVDGRSIYASRPHSDLPARALLGFADVTVNSQTWRTFCVATPDRVIQVAQPVQIRQRLAADAALHSIAPLLLIAPVMAFVVWWVAALTLRPLRAVAADVQRRDEQSLAPLPTTDLPEEVSPLVAALNALLQRLARSLDTQRAFVSDAAHELRSPLTALKLQLQLLRRAPDEATRMQAVEAIDAGAAPVAKEPLDLSEVARQAVADTVPFALSRGIGIEFFADAPVAVQGDKTALAALARNLVDNAVRYSPQGSRVEVRVMRDGGVPVLQVDDAGPGIPAGERERVFDRFYRRGNDEAGTGLGLAIVKSVAMTHGANIALDDSPLGGLRATVRFERIS